jgi:choline dehydrogenase-like flavoprotein
VRRYKMAAFVFRPNLEMVPNDRTFVDLDPVRKDEYGIPLARRNWEPGDNERKMFADCKRKTKEIFQTVGITLLSEPDRMGKDHELGGCRMGKDPGTSMLNGFCQSHAIPNLFVVDGSVFPSGSEKNPTLTIMALAARTADYIWEKFR